MQIVKKFLASGAVANLLNNSYFKGRNAADSADIDILKVNASDRIEFASMPQSGATPAAANDLVNKAYADALTGSGATTALDNLASTAVNVSVLPGTDNSINLGSAAKRWVTGFVSNLMDASSVIAVDVTNRVLKNTSNATVIDFSGTNAQTSVAPSSGNDITNKTYVDSVAANQKTWGYEALTLSGGDITAQFKDLAQVAVTGSISFYVDGVWQRPTTDYTISYTGGAGGKTRLTFAGDLATGGAAALIAADVIHIMYQY